MGKIKGNQENPHPKGIVHRVRRTEEQKMMHREVTLRVKHRSCPFTMVDGIKKEMESKDRYNTNSGVLTEKELEYLDV